MSSMLERRQHSNPRRREHYSYNVFLPFDNIHQSSRPPRPRSTATTHKATKTRSVQDSPTFSNLLTSMSLTRYLGVLSSAIVPTLPSRPATPLFPYITQGVKSSISDSSSYVAAPSTAFGTRIISQITQSPNSASSPGTSLPVISIALISAGGVVVLLVVLMMSRRFCVASRRRTEWEHATKETPLFGAAGEIGTLGKFDGAFDNSSNFGSCTTMASRSIISTPLCASDKAGFSFPKRGIGLDNSMNGRNLIEKLQPERTGQIEVSGFAGIGIRGMEHRSAIPIPVYPQLSVLKRATDSFGPNSLFPDATTNKHVRREASTSLRSAYDAEINTISRSEVMGRAVLTNPLRSANHRYNASPIDVPNTKPLHRKMISVPSTVDHTRQSDSEYGKIADDDASDMRGNHSWQSVSKISAAPLTSRVTGSTLPSHSHSDPKNDYPMNISYESNNPTLMSPSRPLRTTSTREQGDGTFVSAANEVLTFKTRVAQTPSDHRSRYTPSSGRPNPNSTRSSSSLNTTTPNLSDFPMPPAFEPTSTFASGSQLPYAYHSDMISKRNTKALAAVAGLGPPSLLAYENPESPSAGLENMGELMLEGFDGAPISDDDLDDSPVLNAQNAAIFENASLHLKNVDERDLRYDGSRQDSDRARWDDLDDEGDEPSVAVPSITITEALSADDLRDLMQRLSRVTPQKKTLSSASTTDHVPPHKPPHNDAEWSSLSQMARGRSQPGYHGATYSIYGMYNDVAPSRQSQRPRIIDNEDYKARRTSMSTIYNGYGLGHVEDIGTLFAKEVGASLGKIGTM